tara:strand:+ start:1212 stop:1964 length:753 start_codon:yes stop_codon:yes gene_type:complete
MTKHPFGNFKIKILKESKNIISNLILFVLSLVLKINKKNNEIIISTAFYAPWKEDKEFKFFYKNIENLTLLDTKRLYTLWYFSKSLKDINASILDVGCMYGGAGFAMSKANKAGSTYLFDTFEGFKTEEIYHKKEHFVYKDIDEIKRNINKFSLKKTQVFKCYFPNNIKKNLNLKKIKLCHIDVNVYISTKKTFQYVEKRMIKGGVIIFDDYGIHGVESVKKFISKISKSHKNSFSFIYNFMGQCILIKK